MRLGLNFILGATLTGLVILGGVLAALTLRARSIWPAVVLHASYNGLLVLEAQGVLTNRPAFAFAAIAGVGLFALVRGRR